MNWRSRAHCGGGSDGGHHRRQEHSSSARHDSRRVRGTDQEWAVCLSTKNRAQPSHTHTSSLSQRVQKHRRQVRTMAHGDTAAVFHSAKYAHLSVRHAYDGSDIFSARRKCALWCPASVRRVITGRALTILARAQCASPMRIDWFRSTIIKSMVTRVL